MGAKLEINKLGEGIVMQVNTNPEGQQLEGNYWAALSTTLGKDEWAVYYTNGIINSGAFVSGRGDGQEGCEVNGVVLEPGEVVVLGNLKITGE